MELPQMRFRYSYPFISREIPGVNIVSITNRNNDPSALPRCQCFYCCVWGGDAIPPRPSSQLQYSYSSLPSPGNPMTGFNCSCCSPELHHKDAKILKEHKTKQRPHCRICDKTFARVSTLKIHLRIHSGEKPYQCTYCAKAFVQSANLVAHLRTHTGEKPYQCYICEKRFSQSSSVKTHIRTHTGERPFPCVQCGKCFSDRSTLSKHRRVHQKMKTELKDCCIADIHAEFRSNAI